jgi:hypothetical protein
MIHFYLRCSYYKIKIILRKNCKNGVIRVYTSLSESSRVYTSMSRLIYGSSRCSYLPVWISCVLLSIILPSYDWPLFAVDS